MRHRSITIFTNIETTFFAIKNYDRVKFIAFFACKFRVPNYVYLTIHIALLSLVLLLDSGAYVQRTAVRFKAHSEINAFH